jgi:hypothetical protein
MLYGTTTSDRVLLPAISLISTPQGKGKALPCPYDSSEFAIAFSASLSAFCHIERCLRYNIVNLLNELIVCKYFLLLVSIFSSRVSELINCQPTGESIRA